MPLVLNHTKDLIEATHKMSVPSRYMGLWKRLLLEKKDVNDNHSLVLWLQTHRHHIELIIPSGRPDFSSHESLEDCSFEELYWLASQQGFSGKTYVYSDICNWQRELDYQTGNGDLYKAKMAFDGNNTLLETGIDSVYLAIWKKLDESENRFETHTIDALDRHQNWTPAYLLQAANHVALVRPRSTSIPASSSIVQAIKDFDPNRETLMNWMDFEISFGTLFDHEFWRIDHSTLPWKEGQIMKIPDMQF